MKYRVSWVVDATTLLLMIDHFGLAQVEAINDDINIKVEPVNQAAPSPAKPKVTRNRESKLGNLIINLTATQPMLPSEMHPHIERDGTFKKSSIAGTLMQMLRHGKLKKLEDGRYTSAVN